MTLPPPPSQLTPLTFRKRPVTVKAMRLTDADSFQAAFLWVTNSGGSAAYAFTHGELSASTLAGDFHVDTPDGRMTAHEGDWIVQGTRGEFYPVKPEPFEDTFAQVTVWPFVCCDHCECPPDARDGHDDTCEHGCNDEEMTHDTEE